VEPAGHGTLEEFDRDGGVPTLLRALKPLLHTATPHVAGGTLGDVITSAPAPSGRIHLPTTPVRHAPVLVALRGSLAPGGALLRTATCGTALLQHEGPALVFDDYADLQRRIDRDDLPATPESVLILRNAGAAAQGMPEWAALPIPAKLLRAGVRDLLRISDARMSGTASGTVILHAAPEAVRGGPLALVRDGDRIRLDAHAGTLDLLVPEAELTSRRTSWRPPPPLHTRGLPALHATHVLEPADGCDYGFLVPQDDAALTRVEPTVGRS
jgi:dihydroxy-acid dehydratase